MKTVLIFCLGFFTAASIIDAAEGNVQMAAVYGVAALASALAAYLGRNY